MSLPPGISRVIPHLPLDLDTLRVKRRELFPIVLVRVLLHSRKYNSKALRIISHRLNILGHADRSRIF